MATRRQEESGSISINNDSDSISPNDVLCGRGGLTNAHVGNKFFRKIVDEYQHEYLTARKSDKKLISNRIVERIRGNGGRFLKQEKKQRRAVEGVPSCDVWIEVPLKKALEKTSQALREGLDVRNGTVRPGKLYCHKDDITNCSYETMNNSNYSTRQMNPRKRARLVKGFVVVTGSNDNKDRDDHYLPPPSMVGSLMDASNDNNAEKPKSDDRNHTIPDLIQDEASHNIANTLFEPIFTFNENE